MPLTWLKELYDEDQSDRASLGPILRLISQLKNCSQIDQLSTLCSQLEDSLKKSDVANKKILNNLLILQNYLQNIFSSIPDKDQTAQIKTMIENIFIDINNSLKSRDSSRIKDLEKHIPESKIKSAEDKYYIAILYNHGVPELHAQSALNYAKKALLDIKKSDDREIAYKIRFEFATTTDRMELTQGRPQIYGTNYSPMDDTTKGWKKDNLIPPSPSGYDYNREEINKNRAEIGLESIELQEEKWGIVSPKPTNQSLKKSL